MRLSRLFITIPLLPLLFSLSQARAATQPCEAPVVASVSAAVKLSKEIVIEAECKVWSYRPNILIAAVAYQTGNDESISNGRTIMLGTALYDLSSKKLMAHHLMDTSDEGGIRLAESGISIDTARYDVVPGNRAFAVRLNKAYYTSQTLAEGGANDYFNLFVFDGKDIQQLIADMPLFYWEMDPVRGSYSEDDPTSEKAQFSITVAGTSKNGYKDLILSSKTRPSGRKLSHKISYDGQHYATDSFLPKLRE
jgi:hypothetical protein